jgi:hypothetical protein
MIERMSEPTVVAIPHGSVVITPTQMYEEIRSTHQIAQEIKAGLNPIAQQVADHETRLRSVERRMWLAAGAAAVAGAGLVEGLGRLLGGP